MAKIKVITFDLDNTLWDVDQVIRRAEQRMRAWLAGVVPEYEQNYGPEELLALRSAVVAERPELRHDLSALREEVIFRAVRACGYAEQDAQQTAATAFQLFYDARHDIEFFDDALAVLAALARDFELGALTNGNADFRKLKLDRFFSFGFSAASVGASKPQPHMFQAALAHTGAAPDEVIHIGDHLVDDIRGAAQVGMHTIWVNHGGHADPATDVPPTDTVHALGQVPAAVVRIGQHDTSTDR
jgi:2-haloalkanoic acid dehalogenase type II